MSEIGVGDAGDDAETRLRRVNPGDVLDIWAEGDRLVTTVLSCREVVEGHSYTWVWIFLDDATLIEVSPDGCFRYTTHQVVKQGSALFEEIVAQDGVLVRFERHVRARAARERPVHITIRDREYRIASTGAVAVERRGDEPTLLPWSAFSSDAEQNVYFGLVDVEDEDQVGLGLWTTHLCLSFGAEFDPSDVVSVFPGDPTKSPAPR